MIVYPAVDIMGGKCVRLKQGKPEQSKVYAAEPAKQAKVWEDQGAEFLHVVDLDGAFQGEPKNLEAVEKLVKAVNIPVQLGGGIRDMTTLDKVFKIGVERAILGTSIIIQPEFVAEACKKYTPRVVAALDARDGTVSTCGWKKDTKVEAIDIAEELKESGISKIIFTDITSDGTLRGVNVASVISILGRVNIPVIVSGGVATLEDLALIKEIEPLGAEGIIIGTALYEGAFTLEQAIEVVKEE